MNRLNCSWSSGGGLGLRGMSAAYTNAGQSSNSGNSSWRGSVDAGRDLRCRLRLALERRLARLWATSCSIGEPFAFGTEKQAISAFQVFGTERRSVVVAEVELCRVAMQMPLRNVEIATRKCRA